MNTAILLISCPDQKGIVATVSNFLYTHNANILHADEHQDNELNLFFLRVEWDLGGFDLAKESFVPAFSSVANKFKMTWEVRYSNEKKKVAIFVSKEDHCLSDLLYRYKAGELACEIPLIISNHLEAKSLADFYQIPYCYFYITSENKEKIEREILRMLADKKVELVILARYMQILSENFLNKFTSPIINIHHSFLPAFIGAKPYHQAFARGVKIIGATSHYVTKDLDEGPIIEQDVEKISHRDDVEELVRKGKDIEKIVLARAVRWHVENRILCYGNKTVVFD